MKKDVFMTRAEKRARRHHDRLQSARRLDRVWPKIAGGLEAAFGATLLGAGVGTLCYTSKTAASILQELSEITYSSAQIPMKTLDIIGFGPNSIDEAKVRESYDRILKTEGQETADKILRAVIAEREGRLDRMQTNLAKLREHETGIYKRIEDLGDETGKLLKEIGDVVGFEPNDSTARDGWHRDSNLVRKAIHWEPFKKEHLDLYDRANKLFLTIKDEYEISTTYQIRVQNLESEKVLGIMDLLRQSKSRLLTEAETAQKTFTEKIKDLDSKLETIEGQKLQLIELRSVLRLDVRLADSPSIENVIDVKKKTEEQQLVSEVGPVATRQQNIDNLTSFLGIGYSLAVAAFLGYFSAKYMTNGYRRYTSKPAK